MNPDITPNGIEALDRVKQVPSRVTDRGLGEGTVQSVNMRENGDWFLDILWDMDIETGNTDDCVPLAEVMKITGKVAVVDGSDGRLLALADTEDAAIEQSKINVDDPDADYTIVVAPDDHYLEQVKKFDHLTVDIKENMPRKELHDKDRIARFEKHGWKWCYTGGGCTALILEVSDDHYCLITDLDGSSIPDDIEEVQLGEYTGDGDPIAVSQIYPNVDGAINLFGKGIQGRNWGS